MSRSEVPLRSRRWLYRHLAATAIAQVLFVVAALASGAIASWTAVPLLATTLALAAHAATLRRHDDRHHDPQHQGRGDTVGADGLSGPDPRRTLG